MPECTAARGKRRRSGSRMALKFLRSPEASEMLNQNFGLTGSPTRKPVLFQFKFRLQFPSRC